MAKLLRWGILSTAKIARTKIIPAIAASTYGEVVAIGSRAPEPAQACAQAFGIPTAYGSYQALLDDPTVDAIYNPLPNDQHVDWSIKALEAGKHVLCEKPLGLDAADVKRLIAASEAYPHLRVMEAFMYRFHPQWQAVKQWVEEGAIGEVRALQAFFNYNNHEPLNIRNNPATGGGALMDVGCYGISVARWMFGVEPSQVIGQFDLHPEFRVDRMSSTLLQFPGGGQASVMCSTKTESGQGVYISGTQGSITLERPFYCVDDEPNRVVVRRSGMVETHEFAGMDHYRFMVDHIAQCIAEGRSLATPLTDALANMRVIDAVFESVREAMWVRL